MSIFISLLPPPLVLHDGDAPMDEYTLPRGAVLVFGLWDIVPYLYYFHIVSMLFGAQP